MRLFQNKPTERECTEVKFTSEKAIAALLQYAIGLVKETKHLFRQNIALKEIKYLFR